MLRAGEIAGLLARDARGVAQMLLPGGKENNGRWIAGSVRGESGKSLSVVLIGEKAGRWKDFNSDDSAHGDLLDLWAAVRGLSIPDAITDAARYLGVKAPKFHGTRQEKIKIPTPKGAKRADKDEAAMTWLTQARKLAAESIRAYRVAAENGAVLFPAFTPEGDIQYIKYRDPAEKKFWSAKGGKPCLFGWQAIPDSERTVVLCEGELDAIAWHSYGFPALSPTNGASNLQWIDLEFDRLARFDQIYISFDMDEAGKQAVPEIVERLGRDRCFVIELPAKDANECLMQGVDGSEIIKAIGAARSIDPEELVSAADFADSVVALFHPSGELDPGVRLPWQKVGDRIVLRAGEVSLIAGINGHGKSQIAGHLLLEAMGQCQRCCVASMEFKPEKWLRRLTRQASGLPVPSDAYIRAIHRWYNGKLWAFTATGNAKPNRIIEVFQYAVRRYGIRWFVVDNLAKCGFAEDDYNSQKGFIDQLTDFARDFDAHVQVCVHMRKGETEEKPAGKMDIKGTGAITDMVDTVLVIWRNKKKEKDKRVAEQAMEAFDDTKDPDAVLSCVKQRNGEHEPTVLLWFCRQSNQFLEHAKASRKQYVKWSEGAEIYERGGSA